MQLEVLDACPMCGSGDLKRWHAAPDRMYRSADHDFAYSRCRSCDLRFLSRRPTESAAGDLYDDAYEPYDVAGERPGTPAELGEDLTRLPAPWLDLVRPIYRPPRAGARLVDFGCGSAYFLQAATEAGWVVVGTDFSETVVDRVRAAGFAAYPTDEIESVLRDDPVDLVRMSHVLEHVYDPIAMLQGIHRMLRPGGLVHIAIPNPASWSSIVFGPHWWPLEPRHVVLYPPDRLGTVLESAGFEVLGIGHQASPRDLCRSAGYALRSWHLDRAADFVAGSGACARAFAALTGAAAMAGRGDRLHAVGRA